MPCSRRHTKPALCKPCASAYHSGFHFCILFLLYLNSPDTVPNRLNSYFHNTGELRQLSHLAEQLQSMQRDFRSITPLAHASHVLKIDQQTLVIASDNASVAAKLRQMAPGLTEQFQHMGYRISGIRVKVQITVAPPPPRHRAGALSAAGRQELSDFTLKLQDSPLKTALLRLVADNPAGDKRK